MRKDLEFNDLIDHVLLKMKNAGIHDAVMKRYDGNNVENCGKREKGSPLSISTTVFVFLVLITGFILSIFFFLVEFIFWTAFKTSQNFIQ